MSKFSTRVIILLFILTFFFVRDKYGEQISNFINSIKNYTSIELPKISLPKITGKEKKEVIKKPTEVLKPQNQELETVSIYFLALDSDSNGIYKKVQREVPSGENKLEFAINELLKGPNLVEKSTGAYSEIPKSTKLLGIKQNGNKIIINFNSDFQYGGGTDSIYSRMMQLIKTSLVNTKNKKIYLYIDGKQLNTIGGEGIMITQPLSEKSLEN